MKYAGSSSLSCQNLNISIMGNRWQACSYQINHVRVNRGEKFTALGPFKRKLCLSLMHRCPSGAAQNADAERQATLNTEDTLAGRHHCRHRSSNMTKSKECPDIPDTEP